jgi:hypothetical protein
MALRTRRYLALVLALAYGSVSLVGQGLHDLLPHPCHEETADHVHADGHCPHDHDSPHGDVQASQPNESGELAVAPPSPCHDAEHCQICIFLAQAKNSFTFVFSCDSVLLSTPHLPVVRESVVSQSILEPYAPRGPPLVSA